MRASSCFSLPKDLKAKQGCLNIQNNDKTCFLWFILASLYAVRYRDGPTRLSKYQEYEPKLKMSGIQYLYKRYR